MKQRTLRQRVLIAGTTCALVASSVFGARAVLAPDISEFEDLSLTLHANLSDEELAVILAMEVAEEILGVDIMDPAGNTIFQLHSAHPLGVHECILESKGGVAEVLASFPEGTYRVVAHARGGDVIQGLAYLSHSLPARPTIALSTGQSALASDDFVVRWNADGATQVFFEVEGQEALLEVLLPGHIDRFAVPGELFTEDDEVQVSLSSIAANGNRTEAELVLPIGR